MIRINSNPQPKARTHPLPKIWNGYHIVPLGSDIPSIRVEQFKRGSSERFRSSERFGSSERFRSEKRDMKTTIYHPFDAYLQKDDLKLMDYIFVVPLAAMPTFVCDACYEMRIPGGDNILCKHEKKYVLFKSPDSENMKNLITAKIRRVNECIRNDVGEDDFTHMIDESSQNDMIDMWNKFGEVLVPVADNETISRAPLEFEHINMLPSTPNDASSFSKQTIKSKIEQWMQGREPDHKPVAFFRFRDATFSDIQFSDNSMEKKDFRLEIALEFVFVCSQESTT